MNYFIISYELSVKRVKRNGEWEWEMEKGNAEQEEKYYFHQKSLPTFSK